ncbi:cytochrome P450 [Kitasatospora purpeofusca]|uniref:cytochrome P450 n=1 Tax=Kitasatospora purpeofusca TaxID=67352 RepID=UPI00369E2826
MTSTAAVPSAPGARPVVGHLATFLREPLAFLRGLPRHGPLVEISFLGKPLVVVCDPELTRAVLVRDRVFDKGGPLFERLREAGGQGLASCPAAEHRRQRRLMQPAFHHSRFPGYARIMTERLDLALRRWHHGQTVDLAVESRTITADVVLSAVFGTSLDPGLHGRLAADFDTLLAGFTRHTLLPKRLRKVPTPGNVRYDRATRRVRSSMADLTAALRRRVAAAPDGAPAEDNLLSMLIASRDPGSDLPALSDEELVDQAVTMYSAGTETTAGAVNWALFLATTHPAVLAALTAEVDAVLGGRTAGWDDLPQLTYTRQVLTEALRMYPPGWFLTRQTEQDTELGPYAIARGTVIAYSPYLISHLPDLYPDPERFDPDRWDARGGQPQVPVTVFGGGARKCIGDEFSLIEGVLMLSSLLSHWHVDLHRRTLTRPRLPQLTLNPGPMPATLTARRHARVVTR